MNVKLWVKGMVAAVVGGAANAVGSAVLLPDKIKIDDLHSMGMLALGGAIIGLVGYLKKSPVWG